MPSLQLIVDAGSSLGLEDTLCPIRFCFSSLASQAGEPGDGWDRRDNWQVTSGRLELKANWLSEAKGVEWCREVLGSRGWRGQALAFWTELDSEERAREDTLFYSLMVSPVPPGPVGHSCL